MAMLNSQSVFRVLVFMWISVVSLPVVCDGRTWNDTNTLYNNLMANYNKDLRPVQDQSQTLTVNVSMTLGSILDLDEVAGTISIISTLVYLWTDENMAWNPASYGGVIDMSVAYNKVWVPELVNLTPAEEVQSFGKIFYKVKYYANGLAMVAPSSVLDSTCSIDVQTYPFDTQECSTTLYALGYIGTEVFLVPTSDQMDLTYYQLHSSWDLVDTRVEALAAGSLMQFTIKVKRKATFAIINVILPITFLGLLNVFVFLLVPESGERVSYCITVLLAISVFMTITSDTLPKSSEPVPIISYKLMVDVVISMLITLVTILNLRIHNKDDSQEVPAVLKKIFQTVCCITCPRNKNRIQDEFGVKKVLPCAEVNTNGEQNTHATQDKTNHAMHTVEIEQNKNEDFVTWKNIATMIDTFFLLFFASAVILSFVVFMAKTYDSS